MKKRPRKQVYIKRLVFMLMSVISMTFANDIDLNQLVVEAKKTNKHILVFLHMTGCDYCLRMKEFTFDDEMVNSSIKKDFIFVDINIKNEGLVSFDGFNISKLKFAKKMGYAMYPSCLFFDKNGELVSDEVGYRDENRFLEILKFVSSKAYDDLELE